MIKAKEHPGFDCSVICNPRGGLGNRLLALGATAACAPEQQVGLTWPVDNNCPGSYSEVFESKKHFHVLHALPRSQHVVQISGWNPIEIFKKLSAQQECPVAEKQFWTNFIVELRALPFRPELQKHAQKWRASFAASELLAVHLRRTDRVAHHRKLFWSRRDGGTAMRRELPLWQTIMYGVLAPSVVEKVENFLLARRVRTYLSKKSDRAVAIFADSPLVRDLFLQQLDVCGVSRTDIAPEVQLPIAQEANVALGKRSTPVAQAATELLCMSLCDAIAQSNCASSFSLVAALIGDVPIITRPSRHRFWISLRDAGLLNHGA